MNVKYQKPLQRYKIDYCVFYVNRKKKMILLKIINELIFKKNQILNY